MILSTNDIGNTIREKRKADGPAQADAARFVAWAPDFIENWSTSKKIKYTASTRRPIARQLAARPKPGELENINIPKLRRIFSCIQDALTGA